MIRLGLCCIFRDQPIKFPTTTAAALNRMGRADGLAKLGRLCLANAEALLAALRFCAENGIGCFRIHSQVLPLKTHPQHGYRMDDLAEGAEVVRRFRDCGEFARRHGLRTCFHPDQFVVLNSPRPEVVEASIRELEYQAEVAEWVGADVVNIHGGGAYGDKRKALEDFARNLGLLSHRARSRLTVENDDRSTRRRTCCRCAGPRGSRSSTTSITTAAMGTGCPRRRPPSGPWPPGTGSRCSTSPARWPAGTGRSRSGITTSSTCGTSRRAGGGWT